MGEELGAFRHSSGGEIIRSSLNTVDKHFGFGAHFSLSERVLIQQVHFITAETVLYEDEALMQHLFLAHIGLYL